MSRVAVPSKSPSVVSPSVPVQIPADRIAMRAYEKWCQRGCLCGTDLQDWFEAERELQTELQRVAAASSKR